MTVKNPKKINEKPQLVKTLHIRLGGRNITTLFFCTIRQCGPKLQIDLRTFRLVLKLVSKS
jgi:hypothetical protein